MSQSLQRQLDEALQAAEIAIDRAVELSERVQELEAENKQLTKYGKLLEGILGINEGVEPN